VTILRPCAVRLLDLPNESSMNEGNTTAHLKKLYVVCPAKPTAINGLIQIQENFNVIVLLSFHAQQKQL
jgi:hypothetical protein